MTHEYSKFKNKNIPYAKVGRRVFNSLFVQKPFAPNTALMSIQLLNIGMILN